LSEKTLKAYQIDINQFLAFLLNYEEIREIEDISRDHLRIYLQVLSCKYKIKSVKRKVACLKAFFNYLEYEDRIRLNPFRKIRMKLKMPFKLPTVLTLKEVQTLFSMVYQKLSHIKNTKSYSCRAMMRDIVVLEVLFATGLRVSELCNLKRNEIDLINGYEFIPM
jgi:integrase/recombinase XerD